MVFNSPAYHDAMRSVPNYLGSCAGLNAWGWKQVGTSAVAVEKSSGEDAVFILVGKVVDSRFRCGPAGNYNERYKADNPLSKAKYQLSVGVPDEPALVSDFNKAFDMLLQLQGTVANTSDRRYLAVLQGKIRNICLSARVFEERVCWLVFDWSGANECFQVVPITVSEYGGCVESGEFCLHICVEVLVKDNFVDGGSISDLVTMDAETRDWPIPDYCREDFEAIKLTHRVQPLSVYKDETFVEPTQTSASLAGCLAEFHFTIKHYNISKPLTPMFDSFTGNIEEVRILKPAKVKSNKRRNPREGPARTKAARIEQTPNVLTGQGSLLIGGLTAHSLFNHPCTDEKDTEKPMMTEGADGKEGDEVVDGVDVEGGCHSGTSA
jgi:hypothetical protein